MSVERGKDLLRFFLPKPTRHEEQRQHKREKVLNPVDTKISEKKNHKLWIFFLLNFEAHLIPFEGEPQLSLTPFELSNHSYVSQARDLRIQDFVL